jgi:hypothetical protein
MKKLAQVLTFLGFSCAKKTYPLTPPPVESGPVVLGQVSPIVPVSSQAAQNRNIDQEWTRLLNRVRREMALVQGEVKKKLEDDFADLLAETNPGRRTRKAAHLHFRIEKIREAISQEPTGVGERVPAPGSRQPTLLPPSLEEVLKALLPIDRHVPPTLNPEVVRGVICWGFLRPGSKTPYLGGSYTSRDDILRRTREFPRDEVEGVLRWLESSGVVRRVHSRDKQGRELFSMRIHTKGVGFFGRQIIQIIARAAHGKARMG